MLRSFEQISCPANIDRLISADEEVVTITGDGIYQTPWHWHDCLMFIIPSLGALEVKHEDQRQGVWLSGDHFAVLPSHRAHETRAGFGDHHHIALYVTQAALLRLDEQVGSLQEFYRRTREMMLVRCSPAVRSLQELSSQPDRGGYGDARVRRDLASALLVQCIAGVIANEPAPGGNHGTALIADVKAFIAQHANQAIPLDTLGERFGISRRHLTRLFLENAGCSIGEYHQKMRIVKASALLVETSLSVGEIAYQVGFESGAALSRAMRRVNGKSPTSIRADLARSVKS